jgi:two-component system chemotaxis response regulator CheY
VKVLLVEDDFICRKILLTYFYKQSKCECDVASNGSEAIEAFMLAKEAGKPYDLIMLDIMMPEMNGQEVLKRIRIIEESQQGLAATRIVMTTGRQDSDNILGAFRHQCDGYLVKPIDFDKLAALISELKLVA